MKNLFRGLFCIVFAAMLIGGLFCIWYSSTLNEHLEGELYDFNFRLLTTDFNSNSNEKIHIHNFVFYYDFSKNRGNISFYLSGENLSINYIDIDFPSIVDNKTIRIYTRENGTETNVDAHNYTNESYGGSIKSTTLTISGFKQKFNNETFVIEFESNLKPKGRFSFLNYEKNSLHPYVKNVNFVLGDDYECRGACIDNPQYIKETPNSFDRNLQLEFDKEKENDPSLFRLNAISRKILFRKSFFLGLGISLLAAFLSFGLGWLYNWGKKRTY